MDSITDSYGGDVRTIDGTSVRAHHSAATLTKSPETLPWTKQGGLSSNIDDLTNDDGLLVKLVIHRARSITFKPLPICLACGGIKQRYLVER